MAREMPNRYAASARAIVGILSFILITAPALAVTILAQQTEVQWVRTYDSGTGDTARCVVVDTAGNAYVAVASTPELERTLCLIKYDSDGDEVWIQQPWGYEMTGRGLAMDREETLLVIASRDNAWYVLKYDGDGDPVSDPARIPIEAEPYVQLHSVAIDPDDGSIVIAGSQTDYRATGTRFYAGKFSADVDRLWEETYNVDGCIYGTAIDGDGDILIAGHTAGKSPNATVMRLDGSNGSEAWEMTEPNALTYDIAVNEMGEAFIPIIKGDGGSYVAKHDAFDGSRILTTDLRPLVSCFAVAAEPEGGIWACGSISTLSTASPTGGPALQGADFWLELFDSRGHSLARCGYHRGIEVACDLALGDGVTATGTDFAWGEIPPDAITVKFEPDIAPADDTPPPTPTPVSPAGGISTSDNTPTLEWQDVTDPSGVTYMLQLSCNPDFIDLEMEEGEVTNCMFTCPAGLDEGQYWWRVKAVDGAFNESAWTASQSFVVSTGNGTPVVTIAVTVAVTLTLTLAVTVYIVLPRRRRRQRKRTLPPA